MSVVVLLIEGRTSSKVLKAPPPQESHSTIVLIVQSACPESGKTSSINDRSQDEPPLYTSQTMPKTFHPVMVDNLEMERRPRLRVPRTVIERFFTQNLKKMSSRARERSNVLLHHCLRLTTCISRRPLNCDAPEISDVQNRIIERYAEDLCANASCCSDL